MPDLDKTEGDDDVDVGTFELRIDDDGERPEDAHVVDAFEVDIQVLTDSGSSEAASDLDIGAAGMVDELPDEQPQAEDEAPHTVEHELDDLLDTPLESDDTSTSAELGDDGLEELPALVVEDGDGDAGPDVEHAFLPSAPEGAIAAGPRYESEELLLGASCTALAADGASLLAAGEHLMRFGERRTSEELPSGARVSSLVAVDGGGVLLLSTRGLLQSLGGALSWLETPELSRSSGAELAELAATSGPRSVWARLRNGDLLRRRSSGWQPQRTGGEVRALSAAAEQLALLVLSRRPTLQLSSDGGSSFRELLLAEPAQTVAGGVAPLLAARGAVVALADAERGLCVSADAGETFRMVTGAVNVTALAVGQARGEPTVFAALYRESKDETDLIVVSPTTAEPLRIATLSGAPDDDAEESGRTWALLWHDGALYSAGGYGLSRLTPPRS